MSTQTEAMKRWVEVFDGNWHDEPVDSEWADRAHQALAEMRQAIAEAEQPAQQEPVAWMQEMPTQEDEARSVRLTTLKEHATLEWDNPVPLYAAPPQPPAQQAPDYAWPTIEDYEKEVGFEVNIAFRSAWTVARTTNDLFKQMGSDT